MIVATAIHRPLPSLHRLVQVHVVQLAVLIVIAFFADATVLVTHVVHVLYVEELYVQSPILLLLLFLDGPDLPLGSLANLSLSVHITVDHV